MSERTRRNLYHCNILRIKKVVIERNEHSSFFNIALPSKPSVEHCSLGSNIHQLSSH
jgi:hypothetical protein